MDQQLLAEDLVTALKAAAEPTRLRILMLLRTSEFSVKDLTRILGQSQPRLSRHLKLLNEAGLIERFREGSWVYYFVSEQSVGGQLTRQLLDAVAVDDVVVLRDRDRAEVLKREREEHAQNYFEANASEWDRIRARHVDETRVEAALLEALGPGPFDLFVDLGTGTGRILDLFSDRISSGLGIDVNHAMLGYARSKLSKSDLKHIHVRHGDIYHLPLEDARADAVVMHQVLRVLTAPQKALLEAQRVLAPGGQLVVVDFAPHSLDILRDAQGHDRLGFPAPLVAGWLQDAGLQVHKTINVTPSTQSEDETIEKLTVTIWIAEKPKTSGATGQQQQQARVLEEAQS